MGGFSDSRPLNDCVQQWLRDKGKRATLIPPTASAGVAVSKGAVLRALDKEHGPARFVRSSFAILRHQPVDHKFSTRKNLEGISSIYDCLELAEVGLDGTMYIKNCLHWFIQCVSLLLQVACLYLIVSGGQT